MGKYISHYSNKTSMKAGILPRVGDQIARTQLLKEFGFKPIGEQWVPKYGITLVFEGPDHLTEDELTELCLKKL